MLIRRTSLQYLLPVVCLGLLSNASGQQADSTIAPKAKSVPNPAAAYVYVSQTPATSGPNQVYGFVAHANGALTAIAGSPFAADVNLMAVNGKFLFGSTTDELYLDAFNIKSDGALSFAAANDLVQITHGFDTNGFSAYLTLDHTGSTLYDLRAASDENEYYEAFVINKSTGNLTMPSASSIQFAGNNQTRPGAFTFSANNKFMFGVDSGWADYALAP
jgi:hypothetical protein